MKNKNNVSTRRGVLVAVVGASSAIVWKKPIINSIILPAHAQTSVGTADSIIASSLDGDNPFSRFILIADAADNVISNCGPSGGTASATNLDPGIYRVFADSDGPQNHIVDISVGGSTQRVTVPTDIGTCNYLVATVSLPDGTITPASGEQISSAWDCMTNQGIGCS